MVSDEANFDYLFGRPLVSIRFEVRGGFRHSSIQLCKKSPRVSIRFEVRGGFRRAMFTVFGTTALLFQSALRFAVVSDSYRRSPLKRRSGKFQSALRFAVVSDVAIWTTSRPPPIVSIRFEVRGGFRPYPLARCPDKPCCGGFTHHPSSPPPASGQNLSSMG